MYSIADVFLDIHRKLL